MFNEAVIIRGWSSSIPKSTGNRFCVGQYGTTTIAFLLYFLEDLQDYAKRWKTVIIGW